MNIEIRDISKAFGSMQALQATCLSIKQGQFTSLLGPSGCGKTTLLQLVAGLETPDTGEIYIGDECIYSHAKHINKSASSRNFGMVFQDFSLWPHMTIYENIAFGPKARGQTASLQQQVTAAIAVVRLQGLESRYPHQLSGGQQQRVAFARAIATKPRLVLFDEPLSALDAVLRDEMRFELMNLVETAGLTALYVTHDQTEAMSMSGKIAVMNNGQILQTGEPETIYRSPAHPFVAQFIGKANWLKEGQAVFRPEHIRWKAADGCQAYTGIVQRVSYLGDKYELQLAVAGHGIWTAYHARRMTVGDNAAVYVSPADIHYIPN